MSLDQFYTNKDVAEKCYNILQSNINLDEKIGKVYWYLIPHKDMINIVLHYGNYVRGTICKMV